MPLIQGYSEESRKRNVETLIKENKPLDQALAISYAIQNKHKKGLRMYTAKLKRLVGVKRTTDMKEIEDFWENFANQIDKQGHDNVDMFISMKDALANQPEQSLNMFLKRHQGDYDEIQKCIALIVWRARSLALGARKIAENPDDYTRG